MSGTDHNITLTEHSVSVILGTDATEKSVLKDKIEYFARIC